MLTALCIALAAHGPAKTLTVFAAASLKDAFSAIAHQYEAQHPDTTVNLNFAGSQILATQITQGAPADVFASAAMKNLLDSAPDPQTIRVFAENELTVITRKGLQLRHGFADLADVPNIVLADTSVPAGHYAQQCLERAGNKFGTRWLTTLGKHVVSREEDVRAVLAKVVLGEADAGIVYVSDAWSAHGKVQSYPIPEEWNVLAKYPVAITSHPQDLADAQEFLKFLFDDYAQAEFERDGFISPLRPVDHLVLDYGARTIDVQLPLRHSQSTTVVAGSDSKRYRGVPVVALVTAVPTANISFIGADDFARTFTLSELKAAGAILYSTDGRNYQLIDPAAPRSSWVRWIRRIEIK
jgi:molybdate transport system substrate-binding protein